MTRSSASADPRFNAPPRLSDLHGDARRAALFARAEAGRRRYMASYDTASEAPCGREPEWVRGGRLLFTGMLVIFALYAAAVAAIGHVS